MPSSVYHFCAWFVLCSCCALLHMDIHNKILHHSRNYSCNMFYEHIYAQKSAFRNTCFKRAQTCCMNVVQHVNAQKTCPCIAIYTACMGILCVTYAAVPGVSWWCLSRNIVSHLLQSVNLELSCHTHPIMYAAMPPARCTSFSWCSYSHAARSFVPGVPPYAYRVRRTPASLSVFPSWCWGWGKYTSTPPESP